MFAIGENTTYIQISLMEMISFKGTSRGPAALQSHLNDSSHTNVIILKGTKGVHYQR